MKNNIRTAVLTLSLVFAGVGLSNAGVAVGLSVGTQGVNNFYLAVGDYYHAPQAEVVSFRQGRIADEELPVVYFIAQRARVAPGLVVKLRQAGWSWYKIALKYRLASDAFYLGLSNPTGPYSRAYAFYQGHPRAQWGQYRLSDAEIVNCVNLRFLSEHYGCRPEEIVDARAHGRRFMDIHEDLRVHRLGRPAVQDAHRAHDMDWGHGPRNDRGHQERHDLDRDRDHDGRRDHDRGRHHDRHEDHDGH